MSCYIRLVPKASARIVFVDPEPVVRSIVTAILERGGYEVAAVETVEEALAILKAHHPDLLLTNVNLPGMPGRDAVRLFKSICPEVPVLIVSGLPDSDVFAEWNGTPGFDTFPKPFPAQALLDKVGSMLDGHSRM